MLSNDPNVRSVVFMNKEIGNKKKKTIPLQDNNPIFNNHSLDPTNNKCIPVSRLTASSVSWDFLIYFHNNSLFAQFLYMVSLRFTFRHFFFFILREKEKID
jgi:hypothetical protein